MKKDTIISCLPGAAFGLKKQENGGWVSDEGSGIEEESSRGSYVRTLALCIIEQLYILTLPYTSVFPYPITICNCLDSRVSRFNS